MGLGDDIMITSLARKIKEKYPNRQIVVGNKSIGQAYKSIIYKNNPYITDSSKIDESKPIHLIDYHNENRPYIDRKNSTIKNYSWNKNFKPDVGELYFSKAEISESNTILENAKKHWNKQNKNKFKGIIFLESGSSKLNDSQFKFKHRNKDWGIENWIVLSQILSKQFLLIQSIHEETIKIDNLFYCNTDFRIASAVMKQCDLYLGPEGGFSHAAAALSKKAVVYFGGWIHPNITGYNIHKNIYVDIKESPCGAKGYICDHCKNCRKTVSPNQMYKAVLDQFI
tara:strand:- start:1503 stop:2351 length:849 start_codon:yes stop_codon:yes gene_type:complete